jgi:hypothetical protein
MSPQSFCIASGLCGLVPFYRWVDIDTNVAGLIYSLVIATCAQHATENHKQFPSIIESNFENCCLWIDRISAFLLVSYLVLYYNPFKNFLLLNTAFTCLLICDLEFVSYGYVYSAFHSAWHLLGWIHVYCISLPDSSHFEKNHTKKSSIILYK